MSTRGLIGFVHNGEIHASFNQNDSFPKGLGQEIVNICNIMVDWDGFTKRYEKINWLEESIEPLEYLSGKEILMELLKDNPLTLLDEKAFAEDDIFCEYAYLLNLDSKELEIYSHNFKTDIDQTKALLPMNLLASYPLDEIPNHWIEFLDMRKKQVDMNWKDKLRGQGIEPDEIEL